MTTPPALELSPRSRSVGRAAVAPEAGRTPAATDVQPSTAKPADAAAGSLPPSFGDDLSAYDTRRQRLYMILCSAIGALLLAGFALWNWILGDRVAALVEMAVSAVLVFDLIWLRARPFSKSAVRLTVGLVALLLVYNVVARSGDSSQLLWFFVFPLVGFFVLGRREGLAWTVVLWLVVLALLVAPEELGMVSAPGAGFRLRMPLCFAVISVFAYGYERFREQAQELAEHEARRLQAEHAQLVDAQERLERTYLEVHESYQILEEEIEQRRRAESEKQKLIDDLLAASAQVRRLHGLLPICSSCKKIRDDQGYWKQLEEYFHTHSDVVFSHGMCPDCLSEYYPDEVQPGRSDGRKG